MDAEMSIMYVIAGIVMLAVFYGGGYPFRRHHAFMVLLLCLFIVAAWPLLALTHVGGYAYHVLRSKRNG